MNYLSYSNQQTNFIHLKSSLKLSSLLARHLIRENNTCEKDTTYHKKVGQNNTLAY